MQKTLSISTPGRGLHLITKEVQAHLKDVVGSGILNLFIRHTSASLVVQENADPTARIDLENFLNRLVPDAESWHKHTLEGPDDTSSHMKSSLLLTSLNIPIIDGELGLGAWQGIYLWEHRMRATERKIVLTYLSV